MSRAVNKVAVGSCPGPYPNPFPRHGSRPDDVLPALAARFDAELAEREAKRQARSRSRKPGRMEMFKRMINFKSKPAPEQEKVPLERHLSINAMNAAILAFSLPLGAAMFTLSVLGRESLSMTARTMALTGTAMGTSQLDASKEVLKVLF